MIYCKFCTATFPKWWRTSGGQSKNGFNRLRVHVEDEHSERLDAMTAKFEAEEQNKLPNEARA